MPIPTNVFNDAQTVVIIANGKVSVDNEIVALTLLVILTNIWDSGLDSIFFYEYE
jgi:hypothetical protein